MRILFVRKENNAWRGTKTDKEENKLLNKVIIFVFFAHKK